MRKNHAASSEQKRNCRRIVEIGKQGWESINPFIFTEVLFTFIEFLLKLIYVRCHIKRNLFSTK